MHCSMTKSSGSIVSNSKLVTRTRALHYAAQRMLSSFVHLRQTCSILQLSTIRDKDNQYAKLVAKLLLPSTFGVVGDEIASLDGDLGGKQKEENVSFDKSLNNTTLSNAEQVHDDPSFASNEIALVSSVNASFASEAFTPSRTLLNRVSFPL